MKLVAPGGLLMTCSCSGAVAQSNTFLPMLQVSRLHVLLAFALRSQWAACHRHEQMHLMMLHKPRCESEHDACLACMSRLATPHLPSRHALTHKICDCAQRELVMPPCAQSGRGAAQEILIFRKCAFRLHVDGI